MLALLAGCGEEVVPDAPNDGFDEVPILGEIVQNGDCGDFDLIPTEWTVEQWDEHVFHIATLVWVDGQGEDCLLFEGSHEYDGLELQWSNGSTHWTYRTWDSFDHAGFGPRWCEGDTCEVGDIFESDAVYPGSPDQDELQELIEAYGAPDSACGYVANADLIVRMHCGPLEPI